MTPISPARPSSARRRGSLRRTPKRIFASCFSNNRWTDFLPSLLPTGGTRRGHAQGDEPAAGQGVGSCARNFRETWEYTAKNRGQSVMAGARPGIFPRHPRVAASNTTTRKQHHLDDLSQRGQRSRPPRRRHELRHRARSDPTATPIRRSAGLTVCCRRTVRADRCQCLC